MVNKGFRCLRNMNTLDSRFLKKVNSPFIIYIDLWSRMSILLPEDNGKQNPDEFLKTCCL